ncbi:MAG: DUF86 domain-containing protein [bacterium]|nr:DUF86 domain-containing protein [bacterium]
MQKDPKIFLEHILESINKIEKYVKDIDESDFNNNFLVVDAVVRNLEIIGEAARNLDDNFKSANIHIPWRDIADFRNVLIHEYFGVDKEKIWLVIKKDLPELKKEIKILLK